MLSSLFPLFVGGYCIEQGLSETESQLYILVSLVASAVNIYLFAPCKSLIHGNQKYLIQISAMFILLLVFPFVLITFFNYSALAELIGWLLYAVGIIVNLLLHSHWLQDHHLEPLGWYTNEQKTDNGLPAGSPLGNKIALFLGGVVLFGIASLFFIANK